MGVGQIDDYWHVRLEEQAFTKLAKLFGVQIVRVAGRVELR